MGKKIRPIVACIFIGYLEALFFADNEHSATMIYKRCIDDIVGAASCPEKYLQCFIDHLTNFNSSIKYTYIISNNTVTSLDLQLTIKSNHVLILDLQIHTIIFYFHAVIHLHANNPLHFQNCCESNVVVLTMMMSLRSQIKSRITFLHANTPSISLNQPTKMIAQFTDWMFLCHLPTSFLVSYSNNSSIPPFNLSVTSHHSEALQNSYDWPRY